MIPNAQPECELLLLGQDRFEAGPAPCHPSQAAEPARGCVGGCCSHQGNISRLPQAEAHEEMSKEAQISLQGPYEVPQRKTDLRRAKAAFHP